MYGYIYPLYVQWFNHTIVINVSVVIIIVLKRKTLPNMKTQPDKIGIVFSCLAVLLTKLTYLSSSSLILF